MATREEIGRLVIQCCRYFERKEPSPETLTLWHEELQDLDSKYFQGMMHKFSQIDGWPKNFPMKIREVYGMVQKAASAWTLEDYVKSYYRDHKPEIDRDAHMKKSDPMDLAWAEMTYPMVRKGDITISKARYLWNKAKKGVLPAYLREEPERQEIRGFFQSFAKPNQAEEEVPF